MKIQLTILFLFLICGAGSGVTFISSNLPIVVITTSDFPNQSVLIPDELKIIARMKIIWKQDGSRNYLSDQGNDIYLNYNGKIGIETRGSTSQLLQKKPYGFTTLKDDNVTNNNVSILGMPKENDWILNSLAYDPSLIRDYLSYNLYRKTGNYSPRGKYCEVVIDGDYKGLYILMEKIKIDENRVDILKITNVDNLYPDVTGGYLIKSDKNSGGDPIAWTMNGAPFIYDKPNPSEITYRQKQYIYNLFMNFQTVMDNQNRSLENGFPSIIDVPSFVDFFLINELASNVDAYHFSTFFHKDRNGKLRAGPIWDFNLTYGNDLFMWGGDRSRTDEWMFDNVDNNGAKFWKDLFLNSTFKCYLTKRWKELTSTDQPFYYTNINTDIDSLVLLLGEATYRENSRWGTVDNHSGHIAAMKTWIQKRITWLNSRLNNLVCTEPTLPQLVISKIHYHPLPANNTPSDSLEFIEITNNSNNSVDVTGVYFRGVGLNYQFKTGSTLNANQRIYLASSSAKFEAYYGFSPFGQYTRTLSNKSQKIILSDGFGNVIDFVYYQDIDPWPWMADGFGSYLELTDIEKDNNDAANWTTNNNSISDIENKYKEEIIISPNPTTAFLNVTNQNQIIESIEVFDITGRLLIRKQNINANSYTLSLFRLNNATYIIHIKYQNGKFVHQRILKQ